MPSFRTGIVHEVVSTAPGLQRLDVTVEGIVRRAVLFDRFAAPASPGDHVVVNTTAVDMGLGSGGQDFVVWNLSAEAHDVRTGGHIMKLRYTPAQSDVLCVESPESPHHERLVNASSIDGMVVVAASLHSQLMPVSACLRGAAPDARIAYVMTDGAALEASLSNTIRRLRELEWVSGVVTCGHAVGGDLESVNVYSALLAARHVLRADVAVVGMGPGVVGTATAFGTTALELGQTINAAASLRGRAVACVRMSSGDPRERHAGLSHHMLAALNTVALASARVPVPARHIALAKDIDGRHEVVAVETSGALETITDATRLGLPASHMGRTIEQDPLFFEAAGAAGLLTAQLLHQAGERGG